MKDKLVSSQQQQPEQSSQGSELTPRVDKTKKSNVQLPFPAMDIMASAHTPLGGDMSEMLGRSHDHMSRLARPWTRNTPRLNLFRHRLIVEKYDLRIVS